MHASDSPRKRARWPALRLAALLWAVPVVPPIAAADHEPAPTIHAAIEGIRGDDGRIACAFFRPGDDFPLASPSSRAVIVTARIQDGDARCVFHDVHPGTYAIAAIHDENRNGDLDRNWLGIPTEGYGFSENASAILGAPSFHVASFTFDGGELFLTIRLQYRPGPWIGPSGSARPRPRDAATAREGAACGTRVTTRHACVNVPRWPAGPSLPARAMPCYPSAARADRFARGHSARIAPPSRKSPSPQYPGFANGNRAARDSPAHGAFHAFRPDIR